MQRFLSRPSKRQWNRADNFQYQEVSFFRYRRLHLIHELFVFQFFPRFMKRKNCRAHPYSMIIINSCSRCFMYFGMFTRSDMHSNNGLCVAQFEKQDNSCYVLDDRGIRDDAYDHETARMHIPRFSFFRVIFIIFSRCTIKLITAIFNCY